MKNLTLFIQDKIQSNLDLTDMYNTICEAKNSLKSGLTFYHQNQNTVIHKQHEILKNNKRDLYWKKKNPISAAVSSLAAHHVCPNVNE